jgi:hypothetical protein
MNAAFADLDMRLWADLLQPDFRYWRGMEPVSRLFSTKG